MRYHQHSRATPSRLAGIHGRATDARHERCKRVAFHARCVALTPTSQIALTALSIAVCLGNGSGLALLSASCVRP